MYPVFVNKAGNTKSSSVATLTTTYTPSKVGNLIVVALLTIGTVTATAVKDTHSVALTAGATNTHTAMVQWFYYLVPAAIPTTFIATWTTSRAATMAVLEYTNPGQVITAPTGGTGSGATTPGTVTVTSKFANDLIITVLGRNAACTWTATNGTNRSSVATSPGGIILESSAATAGQATTNSATQSATGIWVGASIELTPGLMSYETEPDTQLNENYLAAPNAYAGTPYNVDAEIDAGVEHIIPSRSVQDDAEQQLNTAYVLAPNNPQGSPYTTDGHLMDEGVENIILPPFINSDEAVIDEDYI